MKKQQHQTKTNPIIVVLYGFIAIAFLISFIPGLDQTQQSEDTAAEPYNLIVIMTDNHGPWTLGCYGNRDVLTPNIDQLSSEGMLFERAYASNPVCSPTRATFLTGLMPSQHGVHSWLHAGRLQMGPDAQSTLDEFTSLGDVLKASGYACGLVGKWHLGDNMRPQEGFDCYWITKPHGNTFEFYDQPIIYEGKVYTEPRYTTNLWTEHAIKFLKQNLLVVI